MGGGNSSIDSDYVIRMNMNRMTEFQFYLVITRSSRSRNVRLEAIGNVAGYCTSSLARRLRSVNIQVDQMSCMQPAALDRTGLRTDHRQRSTIHVL